MRNPFFLPSGFETQEKIDILEARRDNKKRLDRIKERKRQEQKTTNKVKHKVTWLDDLARSEVIGVTRKSNKFNKIPNQIQRGYDLATKWGWDGINRPYTPKISRR